MELCDSDVKYDRFCNVLCSEGIFLCWMWKNSKSRVKNEALTTTVTVAYCLWCMLRILLVNCLCKKKKKKRPQKYSRRTCYMQIYKDITIEMSRNWNWILSINTTKFHTAATKPWPFQTTFYTCTPCICTQHRTPMIHFLSAMWSSTVVC